MRTALITLAHGRHDHLAAQAAALRRSTVQPLAHVVVAMDDAEIDAVVPTADVVHLPLEQGRLPLARARNAGVARARMLGAELFVLLDVDCLPAPQLLERYRAVAGSYAGVFCGPVGYLPERPAGGYPSSGLHRLARPHSSRPVPAADAALPLTDPSLFWSLSFALTAQAWAQTGGFCERYSGYGGEDTDFGHTAARAGLALWSVGGAWAYHQHHGDSGPITKHLHDVVRNAGVFHDRWGWWPMSGWLRRYEQAGLATYDEATARWAVTPAGFASASPDTRARSSATR